MIALLKEAYKLADNEAMRIAGLPPPKHELARTVQIFATALVYMAHQARRGHQALEWMRAQPCFQSGDCEISRCPQCEVKLIDLAYDEGGKMLKIPTPKPDLMAPLIESTVNPEVQ
jgi:hypothetical protein